MSGDHVVREHTANVTRTSDVPRGEPIGLREDGVTETGGERGADPFGVGLDRLDAILEVDASFGPTSGVARRASMIVR